MMSFFQECTNTGKLCYKFPLYHLDATDLFGDADDISASDSDGEKGEQNDERKEEDEGGEQSQQVTSYSASHLMT